MENNAENLVKIIKVANEYKDSLDKTFVEFMDGAATASQVLEFAIGLVSMLNTYNLQVEMNILYEDIANLKPKE